MKRAEKIDKPETLRSSSSSSSSPSSHLRDIVVFWGNGHIDGGAGEFIEIEARLESNEIFLRGQGRGDLLYNPKKGTWQRFPTRMNERVLSWNINGSSGNGYCEVSCITSEALDIIDNNDREPKVFRYSAPNVTFSLLQVKYMSTFAISNKGHVFSWGECGKSTGHVGPDTRPGMSEQNSWERYVACKLPMEVVSAMRVVPSDDKIKEGIYQGDFCAFLTALGGKVVPYHLNDVQVHQLIGYKYVPPSSSSKSKSPSPFVPTVLTCEDVTDEKPPIVAGGLPYIVTPPAVSLKRPRETPLKRSAEEETAFAASLKAFVLDNENDDVFKFLRKHKAISRSGKSKLDEPLALVDKEIPLSTTKVARLVELGLLEDD